MITFTLAVLLLLTTPGPGVLSAAGLGAAFGFRAGLAYVTGLFFGSNLVMFLVASGLAGIAFSIPYLRTILLIASTAYLIYLAARIALAGSKIAFINSTNQPGFVSGILLQVINPKAYVVGTTLFSGFAVWPDALLYEVIVKFVIINLIWIPVHMVWLYAGASLKRLNLKPKTQRAINFVMAFAMLGVVALAAYSA